MNWIWEKDVITALKGASALLNIFPVMLINPSGRVNLLGLMVPVSGKGPFIVWRLMVLYFLYLCMSSLHWQRALLNGVWNHYKSTSLSRPGWPQESPPTSKNVEKGWDQLPSIFILDLKGVTTRIEWRQHTFLGPNCTFEVKGTIIQVVSFIQALH